MVNSQEISVEFLKLARQHSSLRGRLLSVVSWADKLNRSIKEPKLRKALEEQALLNSQLGDDNLYMELLPKKVLVKAADGKEQQERMGVVMPRSTAVASPVLNERKR